MITVELDSTQSYYPYVLLIRCKRLESIYSKSLFFHVCVIVSNKRLCVLSELFVDFMS